MTARTGPIASNPQSAAVKSKALFSIEGLSDSVRYINGSSVCLIGAVSMRQKDQIFNGRSAGIDGFGVIHPKVRTIHTI